MCQRAGEVSRQPTPILGAPVAGPLLDGSSDMKPVTGAMEGLSRRKSGDRKAMPQGKFSIGPEKPPRHVLIVDDEPLIRWSIAEALVDAGLIVEQATNAASALRAVTTAALPFDCIVLDLHLPDMDDLSLLGTLRQLLPAAALILMTARGTPEISADAAAVGAAVVDKPFELDDLKRLILG